MRCESLSACPEDGREADGAVVIFGKEGDGVLFSARLRVKALESREGRFNRDRTSVELRRRRLVPDGRREDSPSLSGSGVRDESRRRAERRCLRSLDGCSGAARDGPWPILR